MPEEPISVTTVYRLKPFLEREFGSGELVVRNPGGIARSWMQTSGEQWQPILEGNATKVYAAELDPAVLLGAGPVEYTGEAFLDEANAFAALNGDNLKVLKESGIEMTMQGPTAA